MARRDRDVLPARGLGEREPGLGIELGRIECRRQPLVVRHGDRAVLHHPLARAQQTVGTPVDEHPELRVAIPLARRQPLRRDGVFPLGERERDYEGAENSPNSEMAGQTAAWITRSRTRDVVTRGPRIKRQLPMLVAVAYSAQSPFCHVSTPIASTRWPSGRYSRTRTTLNAKSRPRSSTRLGVCTPSSVVQ